MMNPIEQFKSTILFPLHIGNIDISFTNIALFMMLSVSLTILLLGICVLKLDLVPGRFQSTIELLIIRVRALITAHLNEQETTKFFPYLLSLFLFILSANLIGLIPTFYTVTSQLVVTLFIAFTVFFASIFVGLKKHKWKFFKILVPPGVSFSLLPLTIPVELLSFLSRPISLGIRLFANMVAGHIVLKLFAGFSVTLLGMGSLSILGFIPILVNTAMFGFELLVAILQAYVFMVLTCIYLNDALELH